MAKQRSRLTVGATVGTTVLAATILFSSQDAAADVDGAALDASAPPEAEASPTPGSGWVLTFHDEFDETSIDPCKWQLRHKWGEQVVNHELEAYVSTADEGEAFSFDNGILHIVARKQKGFYGGRTLPYTSGLLASIHNQLYGYFEIRSRMPTGSGMWPAFWLLHVPGYPDIHEIDITEWIDTQPSAVLMTNHFGTNYDTNSLASGFTFFANDLTSAFHVFGLDWEADRIVWYADGAEVGRVTAPYQMHDMEMYVIANLAVGGDLPGNPVPDASFPASYDLDYIRVFQRVAANPSGPPPFGPELTVATDESADTDGGCGLDASADAPPEAAGDVSEASFPDEGDGGDVEATLDATGASETETGSESAGSDATGSIDATLATTQGSVNRGCACGVALGHGWEDVLGARIAAVATVFAAIVRRSRRRKRRVS